MLVKNAHLAKVWFDFPLPNAIFFTLAFSSTLLTQLKPPEASEQAAKKVEGVRCPQAPAGAYAPRTLRTQVLKK